MRCGLTAAGCGAVGIVLHKTRSTCTVDGRDGAVDDGGIQRGIVV